MASPLFYALMSDKPLHMPFMDGGLGEAFGLAVGARCIGFGADVFKAETFACKGKGTGCVILISL
ncbi:MAG: hypothetical protein GY761_06550 [Hyphomicrobiales bacterium]|nr:hypothetical protein [Hyphomicrobiales bacterium]